MNDRPFISKKPSSFLAALMWGGSAVLVSLILAVTTIGLYGVNVVDRRTETVLSTVQEAVRQLPELRKLLPPAVTDAFVDRREPAYADSLGVDVALAFDPDTERYRPVVTIKNKGEEVVSLLSMRVVAMDESSRLVAERTTYAATPMAVDEEWRGPMMPGSTRCFSLPSFSGRGKVEVSWEINDLRVWSPESTVLTADGSRASSR